MQRMKWIALAGMAVTLAEAEVDRVHFDSGIKLEDSFYHHTNGGWLKENPIPPEYSRWGSFSVIQENNQANLRMICERVAKKSDPSLVEKRVGDFFTSGMDEAAINALGATPLKPELEKIAAISSPADILATLAHFHRLGIDAGFSFGSTTDQKASDREIAALAQGGLGLPERGYYFNEDEKSKTTRGQYVVHIEKMLTLLGESPEAAKASAAAVMKLETTLAQGALARVQLRDPYKSYHKMPLSEALAKVPSLDLKSYFAAMKTPEFSEINLAHPDFMKGFASALTATPVIDWQAYLRWHLVHTYAPFLSQPFDQENFAFYGTTLTGTTQQKPRWKRIVSSVDLLIGDSLGQLYVAEFFPAESKQRVLKLVEDLRSSLGDRLNALDWMDEPTKAKAQEKLAAFVVKMGYPDIWKDYAGVEISRSNFLANIQAATRYAVARDIAKIGGPVDRKEWGMSAPTVNAYYRPTNNEIVFPAGILQPPFFDAKADDAVNYGGIGAVIGHEMTHGFDDSGRKYDAKGNLNDWWSKDSTEKFNIRAAAVVKQFAAYTVLDGLHVNGELTQGENIADLGGVKVAFGALKKALAGKPGEVIDGFTPEQRFFISYSTIWRSNSRPEALRLQINTDPHSPAEFRTNGPLSNLDEFAEAFKIPADSPMRRAASERVEIW